jgi:NitT/TauT family transport system ATP-binding protein
MFQQDALLPWKTVRDNVALGLTISGATKAEALARADSWLARVDLSAFAGHYPSQLSGGMRKRVVMAQNWILDRSILLMDEPFSALDAITRDQMNVALSEILETYRKTVIFVTHSIREAAFLSDRVVVMGGRPSSIMLDMKMPFERPRRFDIEETPEFVKVCRQLRLTIEQAHSGSPSPAAAARGSVIE